MTATAARRLAASRASHSGHAARMAIRAAAGQAHTGLPTPKLSLPSKYDINGEVLAVPSDVAPLFTPIKAGAFSLQNRIAYAPLTRNRSPNLLPAPEVATYYGQRTHKGGLMISEGTNICPGAQGYPNTPGIWTPEQMRAWEPVIKAVKDKGGVFVCQLWHTGRASHPEYQPGGKAPLGPSPTAISSKWEVYTSKGAEAYPPAREATVAELKEVTQAYAQAAKNALAVGFDGVEIHGANGYLIDEFIKDSINQRTDDYGGSIEKRCRLALEVTEAVAGAIGGERTGIRISPFTGFLDAWDSTPYATHCYLAEKLNAYNLAYLHMVEPRIFGNTDIEHELSDSLAPFRVAFKGTFIGAGGYKAVTGAQAIANGYADMIAYGRDFLANPDMPKRFLLKAPLNKYDRDTFYTFDPVKGYIDYPFLEQALAAARK